MSLIPMRGLVLLKKIEDKKESKEGILIVGDDVVSYDKGEVIDLGEKYVSEFSGEVRDYIVEVGEIVLFNRSSAVKVKDNGEEFYLIKESEILAIQSPKEGYGN
jgi:chaperonin GroES